MIVIIDYFIHQYERLLLFFIVDDFNNEACLAAQMLSRFIQC